MLLLCFLGLVGIGAVVGYKFVSRFDNPKNITFFGKNAVVTGASTGMGFSFAKRLVHEGIGKLCIISKNPQRLEQAVQALRKEKKSESQIIEGYAIDVADNEQITSKVHEWVETQGAPDYVVTCAGAAKPGNFHQSPADDFSSQMSLNYLGSVYPIRAAINPMIESGKGGHIILVSSALGLVSFTGYSAYSASKYALKGFAEALRNEMKAFNIAVTIYYPSNINSPGFEEENRRKPPLTAELEGKGVLLSPEQASDILIDGLRKGQFSITSELPIEVMRATTNSIQPRNYPIIEAILSPLLVPILAIVRAYMDHVVVTNREQLKKPKTD